MKKKIETIYESLPLVREYYSKYKDLIKPEIGYYLYTILVANPNFKNILSISDKDDISDFYICEGLAANPNEQTYFSIYKENNDVSKDIIETSNLKNYYNPLKSKDFFIEIHELKKRNYKFDFVFINNITTIDEYITYIHNIDKMANLGCCIIINNIQEEIKSIDKLISYIKNNYLQWEIIPNTFISQQCATFIKIDKDHRPWYFHKDF
jgi:hypothetical protein